MQSIRKGKLGLSLAFYPTLAFVAVVLGVPFVAWGILAVVLIMEEDEWAKRQCLQASFSSFIAIPITVVMTQINRIPVVGWIISFVLLIPLIVIWIMQLVSLSRVRKFGEANFPVLWKYAYKAMGAEPPTFTHPQYQPPQGPQGQYQPQPPQGQYQPQPPQGQYQPVQYPQPAPQQQFQQAPEATTASPEQPNTPQS